MPSDYFLIAAALSIISLEKWQETSLCRCMAHGTSETQSRPWSGVWKVKYLRRSRKTCHWVSWSPINDQKEHLLCRLSAFWICDSKTIFPASQSRKQAWKGLDWLCSKCDSKFVGLDHCRKCFDDLEGSIEQRNIAFSEAPDFERLHVAVSLLIIVTVVYKIRDTFWSFRLCKIFSWKKWGASQICSRNQQQEVGHKLCYLCRLWHNFTQRRTRSALPVQNLCQSCCTDCKRSILPTDMTNAWSV